MRVAELWRYPVKSMAAESLARAEIRADGIVGDRVVHVRGAHGRVVTARTLPRSLPVRFPRNRHPEGSGYDSTRH